MPILTERISWSRRQLPRRIAQLTTSEQAGVRKAMLALRRRFGSNASVAIALGTSRTTVTHVLGTRAITASLAMLVARTANVSVSDVLTGKFPKPNACAMCGRVTRVTRANSNAKL